MLSRVIPLEYLKERDIMFWLPPGGQDNDVWADTWVILAELERAEAERFLDALSAADVGAYVAAPSGLKGATSRTVSVYVDREQHNKAVDLLMLFLRGKDRPASPAKVAPARSTTKRSAARSIGATALKVALFTAFLALLMLGAYFQARTITPDRQAPRPCPATSAPGAVSTRI